MRMRIAFALLVLLFGVVSVHAESHIYLTCSHGHMEKTTTFEDGHMQTETEDVAFSTFPIDVDLEHKTINRFYESPNGQQLQKGSVSIGGYTSRISTEHESGYQDTISIDRLSGTAVVIHLYLPPDDCVDRLDRDTPSCRMSKTTTVYHCPVAPRSSTVSLTGLLVGVIAIFLLSGCL